MPTIIPRPSVVRMNRDRFTTPPSPRQLTIRRTSPVARCLFGAPDSKDTMEFAQEEIRKEQQRLAEKYNFDFETDTPLPGNFVYEPIDDVPECLRECSSPKKTPEDVGQRKITEFMGVTKPSKQSLRKRRTTDDEIRDDPIVKSPRVEPVA